jgi:fimbrial isopeptide formation D2 family protein
MFRKIVSNVAFSPALVGQLGFYAKRLRREEATRRIGLIFTALALVVQGFAVFTPPESANAANGNNVIYSGFKNKNELLSIYDRNKDSAGRTDLQQIYKHFGITRQDIVNGQWANINSKDLGGSIQSVGRSTYPVQRTPIAITGTSTTLYSSFLRKWDSTSWSIPNGSDYTGIVGKRAIDGQWFAVMSDCGNPAFVKLPPPPPPPPAPPASACTNLVITPISRTRFNFTATASASNGATIASYTYTIKDSTGAVIQTKNQLSTDKTNTISHDFTKDGSYTVTVTVNTSIGAKTGSECQKALTVTPEPRCVVNPDYPASSPECKPCEDDETIWYKDKDCHSIFITTKKVKNTSHLIEDANNTTVRPGDRLEYTLTVKNTGTTTGTYTIEDNFTDVLEYADLIDTGGGQLLKKEDPSPIERVNTIVWPPVTLKSGESIQKIVSVQLKSTTPATPQSLGNPESYNCRIVNSFGGSDTMNTVDCPTPKVVEQVVEQLPHTGVTENLLFAGGVLSVVVYFYARSRQVKKEVRLIRRDLNAGTI